MSEEKKLEESLAAWVPPWQRVTQKPAEAQEQAEPDDSTDASAARDDGADRAELVEDADAVDEQLPSTNVLGVPRETAENDGEIVDTLEDLAFAGRVPQAGPGADQDVDGRGLDGRGLDDQGLDDQGLDDQGLDDQDRDPDGAREQWPETDALGDAGGGDDEDEQRPETDVRAQAGSHAPAAGSDAAAVPETPAVQPGGGDDEDEQRPETDFDQFAYPAAAAHIEEPDPAHRPDDLRGALEAILLVVDEPVADDVLAGVLGVSAAEVTAELSALAAEYHDGKRGFELRRAAGGWRLYTRSEFSSYVERFVLDGQSVRLTQAALETLAVVAYQQPVTRSRMAAIRGVNCDGVVRTLVSRGLIEECGTQPESGAFLYRTTQLFLEKLGLDSLDQLPALAPFLPDDVNGLIDAQR